MNLAARVADRLTSELGIEPFIINGLPGEFTVLVGEETVARKGWFRLPPEEQVINSVKAALRI